MDNKDFDGLLRFRMKRCMANLSRTLLEYLEDIKFEQERSIERSVSGLTDNEAEKIRAANIFDDDHMSRLRKRILDICGHFSRETFEELNNYKIEHKE